MGSAKVDRNEDATPEDSKYEEDIPGHPKEAYENDRIQTDQADKFRLFQCFDWCDPAEETIVQPRGSMFRVCMLRTWCVDRIRSRA